MSGDLGTGLTLLIAFAVGSIPFGWIIARLWGVSDLRKVGSTNTGATNVTRTAGPLPGALTFLLDAAKGLVPVLYALETPAWIGLAAVAGHCFSPFLYFRGGKGVSTTLGAIFGFNPWLGGASLLSYGLGLATTRTSALGSLFAMLTALGGAMLFAGTAGEKLAVLGMVLIVLGRHRENWDKLLASLVVLTALLGTEAVRAESKALSMSDFRGKKIEAAAAPKRIAALMPSIAETVIDLGAGSRLVAAPEYTRLPAQLGHVKLIGPYNRLSAEAVYSTRPDLVLASMDGNDAAVVEQLEKLGLRVVTINTQSLGDIHRSMQLIATAIGVRENENLRKMKAAFSEATPARSGKRQARVFVQVGWEPLVTISRNTFIDELVRLAGGETIFADAAMKYPRPNPEEVIAKNPDVIVICKLTDDGDEAGRAREFWSRFKNINAVRSGKLYIVPGDWLTKPGFALIRGVNELKRILL